MYEEDILRRLSDEFKPLSDSVKLTIRKTDAGDVWIAVSLNFLAESKVGVLEVESFSNPLAYYESVTRSLLGAIEESLYKLLPGLNVNPQDVLSGSETKIRIDSHVPEDMVLMSPNTYARCKEHSQTFLQVLHGITLGEP